MALLINIDFVDTTAEQTHRRMGRGVSFQPI